MEAPKRFESEGEYRRHLLWPRFVVAPVSSPQDRRMATPKAGCSFFDGREFGVVEWIDEPEGMHPNDLAKLVRECAEWERAHHKSP